MLLRNIWNIDHVSALQLFNFLSGCRFQVPVNQRRAASGNFAAKVRQFSFQVCVSVIPHVAFAIKFLKVEYFFNSYKNTKF